MKKTIAKHEWMGGRLRVLEVQVEEMDALRRQFLERKENVRTIALEVRAENHSIYIKRRLDGLLSALTRLDGLNQDEAGVFRDLEKYLARLLNSDIVDHFSRSLQRRVRAIAKAEVGPRIRSDVLKNDLWYRLRVGNMNLALHGRLRLVRRARPQSSVKLKAGSAKKLSTFPTTKSMINPPADSHRYIAIFATSTDELAVIHCDELAILPSIFRPQGVMPVSHADLAGRMRYGGRTLYIWRPAE